MGIHNMDYNIVVIQDDDVTAAALNVPVSELQVTGTAKRHPTDPFDSYVGIGVAVARLFRKLADDYERAAMVKLKELQAETLVTPPADVVMAEWLRSHGVPPQEMGQGF